MKKTLLALMLMSSSLLYAHKKDVTGDYFVRKFFTQNASDEPLIGVARITMSNNIFSIHWNFNDDSSFHGTGLKKDDQLSFMFQNDNDANDHGVIVFRIKCDKLAGPWVNFNGTFIGFEVMKRQ